MNKKEQVRFDDAAESIKEQFEDSGDSAWLEGWICGFTDYENSIEGVSNDVVHDALFDYLRKLREAK